MNDNIKDLIKEMTLEEKAGLCSGKDFWFTKAIDRLGIPSFMMTDGPHGMRKQTGEGDHIGLNQSVPATCFPSGAGLASSWNRDLIKKVGSAMGKEARAEDVKILLGPGVNIKRSPLCGRNFEYFSEDPLLAGEMAKNHINGIQGEGVGTSIKHYAVNNQESRRMLVDVRVDERTLREIYLPAFETAVKECQPWTVMCAYNKLNGTYCAENKWLLTDVLKNEWGHEGIVVTDWGACNDRVEGLKAGQELEMPGNEGLNDLEVIKAVREGRLDEDVLDEAVRRILKVTLKAVNQDPAESGVDLKAHHKLARQVAGECMVLLKNENGILPLRSNGTTAFLGSLAETPRYQGGGSSHINPAYLDSALDAARSAGKSKILYAPGYSTITDQIDSSMIEQARITASKADNAVVFIGLTDIYESEGFDRTHLEIPENHKVLLKAVSEVQQNVVVVLSNGAPIVMPWIEQAGAIVEGYLGGQAGGSAVIDILWGDVNPSGKLAETFPKRLEDNPSWLNFPGDKRKVEYREGIFVGYRFYEASHIEPLFPFGYGLSYTTFSYENMTLSSSDWTPGENDLTVKISVRNRGSVKGQEVVQIYIEDMVRSVLRPDKELKGFEKVMLEPGEEKTIEIKLNSRSFAFWDEIRGQWKVEKGAFQIHAGASSSNILISREVHVSPDKEDSVIYDQNTSLGDLEQSPEGRIFLKGFRPKFLAGFGEYEKGSVEEAMMNNMVDEMPLRNIVRMGGGIITIEELKQLLQKLNS